MKLRLSRQAREDVVEIALALRAESHQAARGFVGRVDATLGRLAQFPLSGPPRPDIAPDLRVVSLAPFPHLLFYVVTERELTVVRVIDGRRNLPAVFDEP